MEGQCTRWPVIMTPSSRESTETTGLSLSFPLSSNSLSLTAVDAASKTQHAKRDTIFRKYINLCKLSMDFIMYGVDSVLYILMCSQNQLTYCIFYLINISPSSIMAMKVFNSLSKPFCSVW